MIILILFSIPLISEQSSCINLKVCFSSRDSAGIFELIEDFSAAMKVMAVSLPYRPPDASERRFVSMARCV